MQRARREAEQQAHVQMEEKRLSSRQSGVNPTLVDDQEKSAQGMNLDNEGDKKISATDLPRACQPSHHQSEDGTHSSEHQQIIPEPEVIPPAASLTQSEEEVDELIACSRARKNLVAELSEKEIDVDAIAAKDHGIKHWIEILQRQQGFEPAMPNDIPWKEGDHVYSTVDELLRRNRESNKKVRLAYIRYRDEGPNGETLVTLFFQLGRTENVRLSADISDLKILLLDGTEDLLRVAIKERRMLALPVREHCNKKALDRRTFDRIRYISPTLDLLEGMDEKNRSYIVNGDWLYKAHNVVNERTKKEDLLIRMEAKRKGHNLLDHLEELYKDDPNAFYKIQGGRRAASKSRGKLEFVEPKNFNVTPSRQPEGSNLCYPYSIISGLEIFCKQKANRTLIPAAPRVKKILEELIEDEMNKGKPYPNKCHITNLVNEILHEFGYHMGPADKKIKTVWNRKCKKAGCTTLFIVQFIWSGPLPHCVAIFDGKIIDPVERWLVKLTQNNLDEICGKSDGHRYKGIKWCQVMKKGSQS